MENEIALKPKKNYQTFEICQNLKKEIVTTEKLYCTFMEKSNDGIVLINEKGFIVKWNSHMEKLTGLDCVKAEGYYCWDIFPQIFDNEKLEFKQHLKRAVLEFFSSGQTSFLYNINENKIIHKSGVSLIVQVSYFPIRTIFSYMLVTIIRDITDYWKLQEKMLIQNLHDRLTNLYNRTGFQQEMERLEAVSCTPLAILIADVDGLRNINEQMGYEAGDELLLATSCIIKMHLHDGDILARIGSDEFAVLLPNADHNIVMSLSFIIKKSIKNYNQAKLGPYLNITLGFAVRNDLSTSVKQVFSEAENSMYREKLYCPYSSRKSNIKILSQTLKIKDSITDEHSERLQSLVDFIAPTLDLSGKKLDELRLLARFHDIGKIGIPDSILLKSGPLTPEETEQMMKHCEIGYKLALLSPELSPIAYNILCHHEWWNGQGYPQKLEENKIPLESRILAIIDAFDAMTKYRPYRKAIPKDEALAELRRGAGIQFDPLLVPRLLKKLDKWKG